jgi:hypothetical protein
MLHFGSDGELEYPHTVRSAPESVLTQHLKQAHDLLHAAAEPDLTTVDATASVTDDFRALQWFDLPAVCLQPA